jgi:hypothetical protein
MIVVRSVVLGDTVAGGVERNVTVGRLVPSDCPVEKNGVIVPSETEVAGATVVEDTGRVTITDVCVTSVGRWVTGSS